MKHGGWNLEVGCDDGVQLRFADGALIFIFEQSNLLSEMRKQDKRLEIA